LEKVCSRRILDNDNHTGRTIHCNMSKKPNGWKKDLYERLSYEYLIECAIKYKIEDWNLAYGIYLRSEWRRIFPNEDSDLENIWKVFDYDDFVRPDFSDKDFRKSIRDGADFSSLHLEGAKFFDSRLDGAKFIGTHLEGAVFIAASLNGVYFLSSHLERACFINTHLEGTIFFNADLCGADFSNAHIEGTNFKEAYLQGALFKFAIVNGETLFVDNTINDKTDFTGTSLSSARIVPELRTRLERNIRNIRWEQWYKIPKLYPYLAKIKNNFIFRFSSRKSPEEHACETKLCWVDRIINAFVRIFWWISDYGSSTKRIIAVFFGWNILWAVIYYYLLPFLPGTSTTVLNVSNIWAAILQTNLMMFSITDLATEGLDILPMFFVTIHIVVGYFILAALITRLGIMFQNLSP